MNRRFWMFTTVLLLAIGSLLCVARGEYIPRCPNCHRIPDREPCNWCGYGGSSGSSAGWNGVGQSLGNSFIQGYQQGIAAQQEAARRAAEEAAAAERKRQEILQKAAEEARVSWEQQDAANMAAFGDILSSKKKTGGGMSSLLMKQAQQSSGAWNDPNVVDLSGTTNRTPQIPGSGTATLFGSSLISGPLGVKVPAAPIAPLVIPPATQTLPPAEPFPTEYIEFIKETGEDAAVDIALILLNPGSAVKSVIKQAKSSFDLGQKLTGMSTEHFNKTCDVVSRAMDPNANLVALSEDNDRNLINYGGQIDKQVKSTFRGMLAGTPEASLGGGVLNAAEVNVDVWKRLGKLKSIFGAE